MLAERNFGDPSKEISSFGVEKVVIAGNRGPCAGVNMALDAVEQVLEMRDTFAGFRVEADHLKNIDPKFRIYTNWDVVNNVPIMDEFRRRGFISVKNDWSLAPKGSVVFFSAHGVPPEFKRIAEERQYHVVDTTCTLVTSVHNYVKEAEQNGQHIIYLGAHNHPETIGVMGEVDPKNITLVTSKEDVAHLEGLGTGEDCITYTQTTLMPDEVHVINAALAEKYPDMEITDLLSLCYATTNRQNSVKKLLETGVDLLVVVGSPGSHNSQMLRAQGERFGVPAYSVDYPHEVDMTWLRGKKVVGVTSGASVKDRFMEPVAELIRSSNSFGLIEYQEQVKREKITARFKLPEEQIANLRVRWSA